MVLKDVGYPVKLGSGVAAAAAYLSNYTPLIPSRIVKHAWKRYNLSLGLGLGLNKVAGKVFRIGHLGNLNEVRTILAVHCNLQHWQIINQSL